MLGLWRQNRKAKQEEEYFTDEKKKKDEFEIKDCKGLTSVVYYSSVSCFKNITPAFLQD